MALYLARLGIGHSVINLMDRIGISVGCGGRCYHVIAPVTGATSGRVCDHTGHPGLATRDLQVRVNTRHVLFQAWTSLNDSRCRGQGRPSIPHNITQKQNHPRVPLGGILPVPVKTKKINFEARSDDGVGDNKPRESELCRKSKANVMSPWSAAVQSSRPVIPPSSIEY